MNADAYRGSQSVRSTMLHFEKRGVRFQLFNTTKGYRWLASWSFRGKQHGIASGMIDQGAVLNGGYSSESNIIDLMRRLDECLEQQDELYLPVDGLRVNTN